MTGRARSAAAFVVAMRVAWTLTLLFATASRAAEVVDTIGQRMQACSGCHGDRGAGIPGVAFPRLAGQPAAYLATQMRAFRDGVRTYAPMNFLMARQRDAYFDEIAAWFEAQTPDPRVVDVRRREPADGAAVERGRALVHDGRAAEGVPACIACHGPEAAGTTAADGAIPALAGMPRDFLIEQVGSWKSGSHRSPEPNCMATIAKRMSGDDIVAAASWLSLQQPDRRPTPRTGPLPIACGIR